MATGTLASSLRACEPPPLQPGLAELPSYAAGEGRGAFLRMDFNEGPSPDLPQLAGALALGAFQATLYPEYGPLKRAAATAWGLSPECLLPVNGADEGIALALRAFTGPERPLLLPSPTFAMFRVYAAQLGTPLLEAPLGSDFQVDVPGLAALWPRAAMLALASPNNPTGRALPGEGILELLAAAQGRPLLLDETYAPFCGQDASGWLGRFPNLLILRTLSKAYGVPGLRCGFLVGDPALVASLEALRSPFSVNGLAACLGAHLVGDPAFRSRLARAVSARRWLQEELAAAGLATVPSDTHFFLLDLGSRAGAAVAALREAGILVKDMGSVLPGFLRISVPGPREAVRFKEAFLGWLKGGAR